MLKRFAIVLGLLLSAASCGGQQESPRLASETSDELARLAEAVATALDAGACDQALADAQALQSETTRLLATEDAALRTAAEKAAAEVTAGIDCPPPTTTTTTIVPPDEDRDEERPGRGKGDKKSEDKDDD
jgi:hypothetical protein